MDIDEIDAYRAGLLEMLAEVEKTLDARMANVGRMENKDRHQDFIDGLRCADGALRSWVAKRRSEIEAQAEEDQDEYEGDEVAEGGCDGGS
jgi:hypothetical protein